MTHTLIVFDHPYGAGAWQNEPHHRSLSAALLRAAIDGLADAGRSVDVIDLAADGFSPVMTADDLRAWRANGAIDPLVLDYQRRLGEAEHLVFIHPTWWMGMPAGTKGFLDRVLTRGFAFDEPRIGGALVNRLHGLRSVTVLTPMTTQGGVYRWWFGRPGHRILFRGTFGLIGIRRLRWFGYGRSTQRGAQSRERALARTRAYFARR